MRPTKKVKKTSSSSIHEETKQENTPTIPPELWGEVLAFVGDDLVELNDSILTSQTFKEQSVQHVRKLSAEADVATLFRTVFNKEISKLCPTKLDKIIL